MAHNKDDKPMTVEDFTFTYHYGFYTTPKEFTGDTAQFLEVETQFTRALCYAIGSGGVYTDVQAHWIKGYLLSKGVPHGIVDLVDSMLLEGSKLVDVELVSQTSRVCDIELLKSAGRVIIYEMYRCAALENFPVEQVTAISLIASELGASEAGSIEKIKSLVEHEKAVFEERIQTLYGVDHPLLDEKHKKKLLTKDVDV